MVTSDSTTRDAQHPLVVQMSDQAVDMLKLVRDGFVRLDRNATEAALRIGRELKVTDQRAMASMIAASAPRPETAEQVFVPMHLGLIVRNIEALAEAATQVLSGTTLFTERATGELSNLFGLAIDLLESVRDAFRTGNRALIRHVLDEARRIESASNEYALSHQRRLIEGVCVPRASATFLAMLDDLKGVEWHAQEIVRKLTESRLPPALEERRRWREGVSL